MTLTRAEAAELLYREAVLLDDGDWDSWLDLYTVDAVFWMPAWRDEENPTADPDRELSLIYYQGRSGLEDRIYRARSGQSVASRPRPRCVHCISNVLVVRGDAGSADVSASFVVHQHDVRAARSHAFFGRYHHRLRIEDGKWRIAGKKILLLNDTVPAVVDFYSI